MNVQPVASAADDPATGETPTATIVPSAPARQSPAAPAEPEPRRGHIALRATKRLVDIGASMVGLVILAPALVALSALIRLDSPGPVLFRQTRVGRDGVPFRLIKLRSMFHGDSVRATRLGRLLRPLGLDELPQLWNVLVGDMSVVGPRPERPHLVAGYEATLPGYAERHLVRPGITGWAQIHGLRGGDRPISERLQFDLEYVRTWNPALDLKILALTVSAVLRDTRRELRR
jgi:lipopolysaccharide/colanic/teichoic acid biosynthesis glycosyltransferase